MKITYTRKVVASILMASFIFFPFGLYADEVREIDALADRLEVKQELFNGLGSEIVEGEMLAKFKGDKKARILSLPAGRLVGDAVREYRSLKNVQFAEPNYIARALLTPNDPYFVYQWHLDNPVHGGINSKTAWNTSSGSGAIVAIVDTGIAYENYTAPNGKKYYKAPDLSGTCFVAGYDYIENDTHPNDNNSHGTHVAGTVAQSTNNSSGVAGVAYSSFLMPVKVLDRNGSGSYAQVADRIRFAADNGAHVINLSLGGSASSQTLEDAVAYAYNKGVTIVAASGNDGSSAVSYPAAYDDYVIAVGATRYDETRAGYSNYGASLDIVAPGGDTSVDQNSDGYVDGVLQNTFNPNTKNTGSFGYWFFQGTSMATPHAAGVAALVIGNSNAQTPHQVRAALQETADDLGALSRDDTYGWGLVNAAAALSWSAGPPPPSDNPPAVSITSPASGVEVSGVITVAADASDDNGIMEVSFYANDTLIGFDSTNVYEVSWDTTAASEGSNFLTAVARDTAGQTASSTIQVFVDNVNEPPTANAGPDQSAFTGESVSFDGSSSFDEDGTIMNYEWDFGDGAVAKVPFVIHDRTILIKRA